MEIVVQGPVLITGAASGIGRAVAVALAADRIDLALIDVDGDGVENLAQSLSKSSQGKVIAHRCDISSETQVVETFAAVRRELGVPRGYVLNAGIEETHPLATMPTDLWDRLIGVNLRGTFLCLRAALVNLENAGEAGSIVLTGSPAASVAYGSAANSAYAASKAGIAALARNAAAESASTGTRVNVVVPGATKTGFMNQLGISIEEVEEALISLGREVPLGRVAQPEEPAAAIAWLLSDSASYVTGSQLTCDGGLLAMAAIST